MAVQGVKVISADVTYEGDDAVMHNTVVEISHPVSLKEGKLKEVHKGLKYRLRLDGQKLEKILEGWGADMRITLAGEFRKTSDEFVRSINGKEYSLAGMQGEIALARTDMSDDDIEAQIKRLKAIMLARKNKTAAANPTE